MRWKDVLLDLVFPENIYCICCDSLIDRTRAYSLCDSCMEKFHWNTGRTCQRCGKALHETYQGRKCYDCMAEEHFFDRGFSCAEYGLYERAVLMDMKYKDRPYIARSLAQAMHDRLALEEEIFDLIVPVPIHKERRKERGYNQAELLGKELAKLSGIGYNRNVLERRKKTLAMKGLSPQERRENLKDVFFVRASERGKISGRSILLIDDIYTTGATSDSCSRVLKEAGAGKVTVFTFASSPNRNIYQDE